MRCEMSAGLRKTFLRQQIVSPFKMKEKLIQ